MRPERAFFITQNMVRLEKRRKNEYILVSFRIDTITKNNLILSTIKLKIWRCE